MKLPLLTAVAAGIAMCSCTSSDSTQYNGYIKNGTSDSIYVYVAGGDNLLRTEIGVAVGDSQKVYFANADGDNELFDCAEILDSLWYNKSGSTVKLYSGDEVISHTSQLTDDGTRLHECTLEIR